MKATSILRNLWNSLRVTNSAHQAILAVAKAEEAIRNASRVNAVALRSSMGYSPANPFTRLSTQPRPAPNDPLEFLDLGSDVAELLLRARIFPGERTLLIAPADLRVTAEFRQQLHSVDMEVFLPFEDMLSSPESGAEFLHPGWYDSIILPLSAGYFTSISRLLEVCRSLLKPGGRLVIADYTVCRNGVPEAFYIEALDYRFRPLHSWETALDAADFARVRTFSRGTSHFAKSLPAKGLPTFSYSILIAELPQKEG